MDKSELHFGPFRLEDAKQLWRGDQPIHLRRQTLSLLRHLAERPDRLVTKDELSKELWPEIYVSSTVVKVCVREIRHALGDEAVNPQVVETVGGQGYRFIQRGVSRRYPVASTQKAGGNDQPPAAPPRRLPTNSGRLTTTFVGREDELGQLQAWYERVQQGQRQLIFLSGEAGIGKTTLVEHFLAAQAQGTVRIGRGQCIEQHGHGEGYFPLLQSLQQLCHTPDGDQVVAILRRYAPLWLVQLSG